MSSLAVQNDIPQLPAELKAQVLIYKNTAKLTADQKLFFLGSLCHSLGLNPLTNPFEFMKMNGEEKLYAKKDCTDQLRKIYGVSIEKLEREEKHGLYIVTAHAKLPNGRTDSAIGALSLDHLKGEALANALMKAETKAKRRVTLSICGLGFLDESEIEEALESPQARDVAPPALAEPQNDLKKKLDDMFGKFKKLGVTEQMLRLKFADRDLSEELLTDMNKLGNSLQHKKTTIAAEFKIDTGEF